MAHSIQTFKREHPGIVGILIWSLTAECDALNLLAVEVSWRSVGCRILICSWWSVIVGVVVSLINRGLFALESDSRIDVWTEFGADMGAEIWMSDSFKRDCGHSCFALFWAAELGDDIAHLEFLSFASESGLCRYDPFRSGLVPILHVGDESYNILVDKRRNLALEILDVNCHDRQRVLKVVAVCDHSACRLKFCVVNAILVHRHAFILTDLKHKLVGILAKHFIRLNGCEVCTWVNKRISGARLKYSVSCGERCGCDGCHILVEEIKILYGRIIRTIALFERRDLDFAYRLILFRSDLDLHARKHTYMFCSISSCIFTDIRRYGVAVFNQIFRTGVVDQSIGIIKLYGHIWVLQFRYATILVVTLFCSGVAGKSVLTDCGIITARREEV